MKRTPYFGPLTALSLLCRAAAGFPFWLILLSLRTGRTEVHAVCSLALAAGAFALMLWKRHTDRRFSPRIAALLTGIGLLLTAGGCAYIILELIPGALFTAVLLPLITFSVLLYGAGSEPALLFTGAHMAAFLTGAVIAAVLMYAAHLPVPAGLLYGVTAAVSALWLLLCNQLMLDRLVSRRGDSAGEVPADIRKSNLRLVAVTVLLLAAVFLFRRPIYRLFSMFGDALALVIRTAFRAIAAAVRWLSGDDALPEPADTPQDAGEMPYPEEGNPLWALLLLMFVPIVILIWKNLLSDWIFDLRELFQRIRARLSGKRAQTAEAAPDGDAEYTDTETTARPAAAARRQRRSWIRSLRAWHRQPDSDRKFYAGYALMLEAPAWGDAPPNAAETACEIRERWKDTHDDALGSVTEDLHADRYAQTGLPAHAVADAAAALDRLRHEKNR